MLTTGNQLKAARALVGINQGDLAKAARINVATISAMEGKGPVELTSGVDTVLAVARALEACGIELLAGGGPAQGEIIVCPAAINSTRVCKPK